MEHKLIRAATILLGTLAVILVAVCLVVATILVAEGLTDSLKCQAIKTVTETDE